MALSQMPSPPRPLAPRAGERHADRPAHPDTPATPGQVPDRARPVLQVRDLVKSFGDETAVKGVSFDVHDGEFVFIIGPSGCGKTTTLRMIGGYESPTSGEIVVQGRVMNDVPLHKRNIGMVFQTYALFPHMTVHENVAYGLRMRRVPREDRRARVREVLEQVELSDLEGRYPVQLSGGQRQRVALARVLAFRPDILLLDEPLANLDKRLRDSMRVELKKLQERVGITTIYVTHDQEEALSMADRLIVMNHGEILQSGPPAELYNAPRTSFVATFLGETSSFPGTVDRVEDGVAHVVFEHGIGTTMRLRGDLQPGQRVLVSIRPEALRLCPPEVHARTPGARGNNAVLGTVDFVSYLGSHALYIVRIDGCRQLVRATEPIPDGAVRYAAGDRVAVRWDDDHVVYVLE